MKRTRLPTLKEIDELTAFLPRLHADGFSPVIKWEGGKMKNGTIQMPYPNYDKVVTDFFHLAASECWLDYEYTQNEAAEMLRDENLVKTAPLEQIKTMLTFCLRGERFSDGHWGAMIEGGYIRHLLERLNEIKSTMTAE